MSISYGSWYGQIDGVETVFASVVDALGSALGPTCSILDIDDRWDVDAITEAYQQVINQSLPDGVYLGGGEFWRPESDEDLDLTGYPQTDYGDLDLREIVRECDEVFWAIADRYER
jgi:hypothetical protein